MSEQNKNNHFFKKLSKLTLGLLFFLICAYLILGFAFDRHFFARDAQEKYGRVLGATTLSLRIIGPPEQPVLATESLCSYGGSPFVRLTWNSTRDTDDYSLARDGSPLVNGLTQTTYDDYAVAPATAYSYVATAIGPAGQTSSDPEIATTNPCDALPDPTVDITKINVTPIIDPLTIIQTQDRTPTFYGTTNITNAIINIELNSSTPIIAQTSANAGGFWEWTTPTELELGLHSMEVVAIDPLEPSRRESFSIQFEVIEPQSSDDGDSDKQKSHKKKTATATPGAPLSISWPKIETPFSLSLSILNKDAIVFTGQELTTRLAIQTPDANFKQVKIVDYLIVDSSGKIVFQTSSEVTVFRDSLVYKNIALPRLLKNGNYKVITQTTHNGVLISAESFFHLQEAPLIIAGPITMTLTELTENLSWVITILSLLLLIFMLLLSIEYWLYKHSKIHITERLLAQEGFLGKRKGVLR